MQTIFAGDERTLTDQLFEQFQRTSPTAPHVVQQTVPSGMAADMMRAQLGSGRPADLYWFATGALVSPMIDAGRILDLGPLAQAHKWEPLFLPGAWQSGLRHGKLWAIPRILRGLGFWYRKDLFERAHIPVPTTYASLEAACETLLRAGVPCLSLGGRFGWNTMRLLDYFLETTAGPALHDQLNQRVASWDRPEVVAAYRRLAEWGARGFIIPNFLSISPEDARLPFYKGDAAMVFEGDWMESVFTNDEIDSAAFDFFLPPTDHEPQRFAGWCDAMMMPAAAAHADQTAAFIDWFLSPDVQLRYARAAGTISARQGIEPDARVTPRLARWRHAFETHPLYPPTDQVFPKELMDRYLEVQDLVVAGRLAPEQAAQRLGQM